MIFASQIFLFWFLPLVLGIYYAVPTRARSLVLVLASYLFYGWWRLDFTLLMVISTVIDYFCGRGISRANAALPGLETDEVATARLNRRRKRLLLCSIIANLGLLAYFKYMNFGVDSLNAILASAGMEGVTWPSVVLPVGISFYTFQTMSYSIDVFRGEAPPVRRFIDFACYVALFPQLVAGPIVRYRSLADQLFKRSHTLEKFSDGALLFQAGFIKKILLADIAARVADAAFSLSAPSCLEAWLGTTAYAFQIYFDFSGYSDMAIGLGLMFGFRFPINFDSPYKSQSITEFWRRWHISLSSWLRDYLYIPLGGNRYGPSRTYANLMITMLLGGLWHGAAWTFIAWGAYQGFWLALERMLGKKPFYAATPKAMRMAVTFVIVLGGWVLFRAETFAQAQGFFAGMFGFGEASLGTLRFDVGRLDVVVLSVCALLVWLSRNSQEMIDRGSWLAKIMIAMLFPLAICQLFFSSYSPFLYFRF